MLTELAGRELQTAVEDFRRRVAQEMASRGKTTFKNPSGLERPGDNYEADTPSGLLSIVITSADEDPTRYIHAVTLNPTHILNPTLRLNLSRSVHGGGRTSTVVARDSVSKTRYLLHRGDITVHKKRMRRMEVIEYFERCDSVVEVHDGDRKYRAVRVADLDAPSLFDDIALFLRRLNDLKMPHR